MKNQIIISLLIISITFVSCKEEEPPTIYGCTDASAENYNSSATEEDGSCTYKDTTTFSVKAYLIQNNDATYNSSDIEIIVSFYQGDQIGEVYPDQIVPLGTSNTDLSSNQYKVIPERLEVDREYMVRVNNLNGSTLKQSIIGITGNENGYYSPNSSAQNTTSDDIGFYFVGNATDGFFIQIRV